MFDAVVVATDGSTSGKRAVRSALDLADRFDAAVHALSVVDADRAADLPADATADPETTLRERAEAAVESVVAGAPAGMETTTAVREGRPAAEIVAYADEVDADAVAMGTRGRGGEGGFLLGSVAEAVVRTCERPVLTVRRDRAGDAGEGADRADGPSDAGEGGGADGPGG